MKNKNGMGTGFVLEFMAIHNNTFFYHWTIHILKKKCHPLVLWLNIST